MRRFLIVVAACGSPAPVLPDAPIACRASLSGNVAEQDGCTVASPFAVTVPTTALGDLAIAIDATTPGTYSPANVATWSASAVVRIANGACVYQAGAGMTPAGSFSLALDGAMHGTLRVELYVLATPGTDCGDGDQEVVDATF